MPEAPPVLARNRSAHNSGGGRFPAVLHVQKESDGDEGVIRQASRIVLAVSCWLKNVTLVEEDVDLFGTSDVFWAPSRFRRESK